jgi:acetyl-CoA carboxylase beta subunit
MLRDGVCARAACKPLALGSGNLQAMLTTAGDKRLLLLCFDYALQQGSIGMAEADQLQTAVRHAREHGLHMVWLIESSGIRVTDGTAGIASLRRVLRDVQDARLDGLRLLAMVFKSAFGGASILTSVCERRVMHAGTLLSMSGPKLIEQSVGAERFNASDKTAVSALLGGAARAARSADIVLVDASLPSYLSALDAWLADAAPAPVDAVWLQHQLSVLTRRLPQPLPEPKALPLPSYMLPAHAQDLLERVLPTHSGVQACEGVLIAQTAHDARIRVLALMTPTGCTARDALALTRELLRPQALAYTRSVLLVDAPGHAATPEDEQLVFSEVLALLSLAIRWLHRQGQRVDVVVSGTGGGGIQAALAAGASSVSMGPQARLYVLPKAAMQALNKAEDEDAGTLATALATGAIDHAFTD